MHVLAVKIKSEKIVEGNELTFFFNKKIYILFDIMIPLIFFPFVNNFFYYQKCLTVIKICNSVIAKRLI